MFIIQDNESNTCGIHCIAFIEHMHALKTLQDYINLLFPNNY